MTTGEEDFLNLGIDGVYELIDFYRKLDNEISEIKKSSGFTCFANCGACCNVPSRNIEATVFEMIPLAICLVREQRAEDVLNELYRDNIQDHPCVIYKKISEDGKSGFCHQYGLRPIICRLFGSGVRKNKDDRKTMILCSLLKQKYINNPGLLNELSDRFPLSSDVSEIGRSFNLILNKDLLPLNIAIKKALEYVMFRKQYLDL